jgi:hypothetical protein
MSSFDITEMWIRQAEEKIEKEREKIRKSEEKIKDWQYHIDVFLKPNLGNPVDISQNENSTKEE